MSHEETPPVPDPASLPLPAALGPRWKRALRRVGYWTPVLVPMVLFAQVAFLGLRPAVCEKRRLEEADGVLRERRDRDRELAQTIWAHARARQDGVFTERQRRLRELPLDVVQDEIANAPAVDAPASESTASAGPR